MVGGEEATFERYRPVLESMGRNIFHLGGAGTGCIAKLVTQYLEVWPETPILPKPSFS